MRLTGAQTELLEAMRRGVTLRADRIDGRHKAQTRILREDSGEDVTSVANKLRDMGFVRSDYTLAKAGRKVT